MLRFLFLRLCLVVCVLSVGIGSFASYATTYDHLLSGDVGEFITPADDDFTMRNARSSIATIENTVKWIPNLTTFRFRIINEETGASSYVWKYLTEASDTEARIKYSAPDGYYISQVNLYNVYNGNYSHSPDPGTYNMELDVTSQFSHDVDRGALFSQRRYDNANNVEDYVYLTPAQSSGDFYLNDVNLTITSGLYRWGYYWYFTGNLDDGNEVHHVDYTIRQRFEIAEPSDDNFVLTPSGISSSDSTIGYQEGISSSLSDVNANLGNISSSMQEQAENISAVETAVNNLRGAMEPHYEDVLTQLHHITEQLHAFWDQLYNMFYLPQYARLGEILAAIENLDVNITVDVDGLKSTINTMSTNIQNKLGSVQTALQGTLNTVSTNIQTKLQSVKDGIETELAEQSDAIQQKLDDKFNHLESGFDNSGINEDASRLDDAFKNLDDAEQLIFGDLGVLDSLSNFDPEQFISIDSFYPLFSSVQSFSSFIDEIYMNLGGFQLVVNLSLFFFICFLALGFYRFRG